ncbi:PREDICTED: uncharacterized protein LOC109333977 [Lupinus angustifolius]|uniref:uncharacterized protein LOC109333977 n=1 Tax=Lupinus angustifolius TaxID=3871 RepID=UPI00092EF42D|nr:PREDICTED: uncharacterized protein LOC109333977 [Lupinus angustifolius]
MYLSIVLALLHSNQFYAKLSKYALWVDLVGYLRHIISSDSVMPDPNKIKVMVDWPPPRSLTALYGFLGFTEFCRKFAKHYTVPLTDLLKHSFTCTSEAQLTFTKLQEMTKTLVLRLPDFTKDFDVETDASFVEIDAMLSQEAHPLPSSVGKCLVAYNML